MSNTSTFLPVAGSTSVSVSTKMFVKKPNTVAIVSNNPITTLKEVIQLSIVAENLSSSKLSIQVTNLSVRLVIYGVSFLLISILNLLIPSVVSSDILNNLLNASETFCICSFKTANTPLCSLLRILLPVTSSVIALPFSSNLVSDFAEPIYYL